MPAIVQKDAITTIPNVIGSKKIDAFEILLTRGLKPIESETRKDEKYPFGTVTAQNPSPGTDVKVGRGVYLTISGGETQISMPLLVGRSIRDATFALERFRLQLGNVQYQTSPDVPENVVISQSVDEGSYVSIGATIDVVVSLGSSTDKVPVPDLIRKSLSEAETKILKVGLQVGVITQQTNQTLLPNTVIDQFPRAGELVIKGRNIDLFIAVKPEKSSPFEN
jgi:beta-lactam-binding protein with PASTA domain